MLRVARVAGCICCQLYILPIVHVASCTCCELQLQQRFCSFFNCSVCVDFQTVKTFVPRRIMAPGMSKIVRVNYFEYSWSLRLILLKHDNNLSVGSGHIISFCKLIFFFSHRSLVALRYPLTQLGSKATYQSIFGVKHADFIQISFDWTFQYSIWLLFIFWWSLNQKWMHTNKIENRYKIYMGMAKENPIKLFILVHLKLRFWKKQSGAFFFRHPVDHLSFFS